MSVEAPESEPKPAPPPEAQPAPDAASPVSDAMLEAALADLLKVWRRIEKRAPDAVRRRVDEVVADAAQRIGQAEVPLRLRIDLARRIEDLGAEVRGRKAFEPSFYAGGRFGIIKAWDPITIQGSIDQVRVEKFFERYMRRAEAAFERLDYFFTRAGLLQPKEKVKRPAWEQPYANFEQYRELIWGKKARATTTPPKPRGR